MKDESFFLKVSKCKFEQNRVEYLGLLLDGDTIKPDPNKVEGLKNWPRTLKTVLEVCSTLGLLNYHRAFIPGFSHIVQTTHPTTENEHEVRMDPKMHESP